MILYPRLVKLHFEQLKLNFQTNKICLQQFDRSTCYVLAHWVYLPKLLHTFMGYLLASNIIEAKDFPGKSGCGDTSKNHIVFIICCFMKYYVFQLWMSFSKD